MPQAFLDLAPAARFAAVVFALLSLATLLVWLALAMLVAAAYLPIFKMSVVVS